MKGSPNSVLIIGGGAAGCAAAAELSRRGASCTIVEAADRLGGLAGSHCCKSTERCQRCDACLPVDVRRDALSSDRVAVMTSSRIADIRMDDGAAVIAGPDGIEEVSFGSIIVSVGATPFDPALDPRLGHGSVPGVMSALEVDRRVRDGTFELPDGARLAVVQCVGSRDAGRGAAYCSKVCCKYAYQLARHLQTSRPGLDITFFHMDWRPWTVNYMRSRGGVRPSIGDTSRPPRWWNGTAARWYAMRCRRPGARARVRRGHVDRGPATLAWQQGTESMLASLWTTSILPSGPRQGMAAGCCTGPKDIDESVKEGIAAAGRAATIMEGV